MSILRSSGLKIYSEQLNVSDGELVSKYKKLSGDIAEKKKTLDRQLMCADKNNYLSTAVARLIYGFAKEEFNALFNEIERRGLITN